MSLSTPVVFIIFRRPDVTAKVFEQIRLAQPQKLFVVADGPRNAEDIERCQETRAITEQIDWDCEVFRNYSDVNLGCKRRVSSGLDWAFEQVEEAIILEDDCLPHLDFFNYCSDLLERYKDDNRIMLISGFNRQGKWKETEFDYFFSHFGGIWGWASWRRAWQLYDPEMTDLYFLEKHNYFEYLLGKDLGRFRCNQMIEIHRNNVDTWAFPWALSRHRNSGMACVPSKNLIENIGFGSDATHTLDENFCNPAVYPLEFPLRENKIVIADRDYDKIFFPEAENRSRLKRLKDKIFYFYKKLRISRGVHES